MKELKNECGFTLIELLSVIIILAVILIIAVPTVLDAGNKAKDGALQTSADAVSDYYAKQYTTDSLVTPTERVLSTFTDGIARCITSKEAEAADLSLADYLIVETADATLSSYLTTSTGTPPCSYVSKSTTGKFSVTLVPTANGKFSGINPKTSA